MITIPYKRRERAKEADEKAKRFNVLVIHRRAGKSVREINNMIRRCCTHPAIPFTDGVHAYVGPTYRQTKSIIRQFAKYYAGFIPGIKTNESELSIVFPNNHKLQLFGSDNPDSLVGLKYYHVTFEEFSIQNPEIWTQICLPSIAETKGTATFIGTPRGKNHFYDLYEKAKDKDDRYRMLLKASECKLLDPKELEMARAEMPIEEYMQEFECSREGAMKGSYYSEYMLKAQEEDRICLGLYDKALPVYTARDLGISDDMTIIFFQMYRGDIYVIDCYNENGSGYEKYQKVIQSKPYIYEKHLFPHDVRARSRQTGESDFAMLGKMFGVDKCEIVPQVGVDAGIRQVKHVFDKIRFEEEKTEALRNALLAYRREYDEKNKIFKDKPLHDRSSHYADAFRYMCVRTHQMKEKSRQKTKTVESKWM